MQQKNTIRQIEIIHAASRILTKSGINGLTIKNLAKEMQFSESAIYRHFASKEEIILAMLQYMSATLDDIYNKSYLPDDDPEDKLIQIVHNKLQFFKVNPHFSVVVFSDGLMEVSSAINNAISDVMSVKFKHLKPIISEGQASGVFNSELSEEELIHIIMGALRLQMLKWRFADFGFDIVATGDKQLKNILLLLKK